MAKDIVVVTGSRAEYGLLHPVLRKLKDRCKLTLLVTGSHLSQQHGYTAQYIDADIHQVHVPGLVDYDQPLGVCLSMANFIPPMASALQTADKVVLLGDRYEMLSAALAAYNTGVPIAHIQGGDVTKGSLDDGYRDCITRLATEHYVATYDALDNVQRLQRSNDQHVVGSLACVLPDVQANDEYEYIVVVHPDQSLAATAVLQAIAEVPGKCLMIGPNVDVGGSTISEVMKMFAEHSDQFDYVESMPRPDFLAYLKGAKAIVGNSSCGIFEAPMLKTRTINVGRRQEGRLRAKSIVDCKSSYEEVKQALLSTAIPEEYFKCPYYQEGTVEAIVDGVA